MKAAVVYFDFELRDRCVGSTRSSKSKSSDGEVTSIIAAVGCGKQLVANQ